MTQHEEQRPGEAEAVDGAPAAPLDPDDEPPAAIRRSFVYLTAVGGVVCLLPRQWVSAGILFVASAAVLAVDLFMRSRARRG